MEPDFNFRDTISQIIDRDWAGKVASAEKAAGLKPDTIRNLMRSEKARGPTLEIARKIAVGLGLEFYIGPPLDHPVPEMTVDDTKFASVRRFDVEASAGAGAVAENPAEGGTLMFRREWLDTMNIKPAEAYLLKVRGDSMSPLLSPGDLVLVDQIRRFEFNGQVFAFCDIDGQTRVKRIDQIDKSTLALRSDNPEYPVELRRGEELNRLRILGQIVWSGHSWKD